MARDTSRRTEGSLLTLVLLILAVGFLLVFLAKTRAGVPADAVNLNTATAEQMAVTFQIDPALASILAAERDRLGGFSHTHQPALVTLFPTLAAAGRAREALARNIRDVNAATMSEFRDALGVPRAVARRIVDYRASRAGGRFRSSEGVLRVPVVDASAIDALGDRLIVRHPMQVFWWFAILAGALLAACVVAPIVLRRAGVEGDPYLVPFALLLAGLGVMALFSIKDPLRDMPAYAHQVVCILAGLGALLAGAFLPAVTRRNLRRYTYLWALASMALLLGLRLFGYGPEGVRLSLSFFQPVELIKLMLVLFAAGYLVRRGELMADPLHRWRPPLPKAVAPGWKGLSVPRREDIAPMAGIYVAALLLFLVVRDLGPAVLLFGAFLGLLYLATGRSGIVWVGVGALALGAWGAYVLHIGVAPVRVHMWLSPWDNPHPNGMQLGQALWGMASGGLWGSGLGLGSPGLMPRAGSDLAFASIGEELGLIGSLAVLMLYALLVARGLRVALRAQNDFDRLLAAGLTALLGCQVVLIVGGVTGLLPLTGITLPFVSYGGSSLLADFFLIGLLRAISSPDRKVQAAAPPPVFRRAAGRFAFTTALVLLGVIGVGRLFWVQALSADQIAGRQIRTPDADRVARAKINPRLAAIEQSIPRGSIYDRKGRVLATSRLAEISQALPDDAALARRYFRAGRYYPRGVVCAHLVGYLDPTIGGPNGLEREFNRDLRGFDHYSDLLADYRAKDLPSLLTGVHARVGHDVVATIDADLQEEAVNILQDAAGALRDRRTGKRKDRAAMVLMDPATGEVIVSAAIPSYDPNSLSRARWQALLANADRSHRLVDRARQGYYPPGSSLKIATAAAGLEEGLEPQYTCRHVASDLRWVYHGKVYARRQLSDDRGESPHGRIGMERAIAESCNLYFATLGMRLGASRLYHAYADRDRFALGRVQPLDVFARDLPANAFGQGTMAVTPTEMARVAGSVANRGAMMQPVYWREVHEPGGRVVRRNEPAMMGRPIGELNAGRLASMMRGVVTHGTASGVFTGVPVEVAGKTGTAQTEQGDKQPHSWFVGFAPFSRPQYAFACVIENGGYGKQGAAPAVAKMLQQIYGQ